MTTRDFIYQFPTVASAEYIILNAKDDAYPLTKESLENQIAELKNSPVWEIIYDKGGVITFRKKITS